MRNKHRSSLALCTLLLFGCGSESKSDTPPQTVSPTEINATIIDGYLRGAKVWLDINENFELDANEPFAISGAKGKVVIDTTGFDKPNSHPIVVQVIKDETIDESTGQPVTFNYVMSAPKGELSITPLSTLVHIYLAQNIKGSETPDELDIKLQNAIEAVASSLGIKKGDVLGDFIDKNRMDVLYAAENIVSSGVLPEAPNKLKKISNESNDILEFNIEIGAINENIKQLIEYVNSNENILFAEQKPLYKQIKEDEECGTGFVKNAMVCIVDTDNDGISNNKDTDDDADGVIDNEDAFPLDATESSDTDGDGIGDNADKDTIPTITLVPRGIDVSSDESITVHKSTQVYFDVNARDTEDGEALDYSWRVTTFEGTLISEGIINDTQFSWSFINPGKYIVAAEVIDADGNKVKKQISVLTLDNIPTLQDINIVLNAKESNAFDIGIGHTLDVSINEKPVHGITSAYLVGGESWSIRYESADCFTGNDSFIYRAGEKYGRVNITITSPSTLTAPSHSLSLDNRETIDNNYLTSNKSAIITTPTVDGASSLITIGNETVHFSYDPDNDFIGSDYFEYKITETINECPFSAIGRVNFDISEHVVEKRVISACQNPYTIGTEPYITDGTLAGTALLKDLKPGHYSEKAASTGFREFDEKNRIGNTLYFTADYSAGGANGRELYETDATKDGTFVHDINTNNEFTGTYLYGASNPSKFIKIDDNLFFIASDSTFDRYGMYKANGQSVTRVANDVTKSPVKIRDSIYYFSSVDNTVNLYKFNSDFSSSELVDSFATNVSGSNFTPLTAVEDNLIYLEYMSSHLWYGLHSKTAKGNPVKLTDYEVFNTGYERINGKIYMIGDKGSYSKAGIIETDGTLTGTSYINVFTGDILAMAQLNGKIYFKGLVDPETDDHKVYINLYELDITTNNLTFIANITHGVSADIGEHSGMGDINVIDGKLIYESVNEEIVNGEKAQYELLWVSDGSAAGTVKILRRERIQFKAQAPDLTPMFELNNAYYFQDNLGQLYTTDFSKNGTTLVLNYVCGIYASTFSFDDVTDAELDTIYEASMTVEGITYPATKLAIENGEYSLNDGLTWSAEATTIANGQVVKVRHTSSSNYETSVSTKLRVGGRSDSFSSTTKPE